MHCKIKVFIILVCAVLLSIPASAAYITDSSKLSGSDYSDNAYITGKLDDIFSGSIGLYEDIEASNPVSVPPGSSVMTVGNTYYVKEQHSGNLFSGSSCYIYANAVYNYLFCDVPYHGYPQNTWCNSVCAVKNAKKASYELFTASGINIGALMRTTKNSDGSYNGSYGHSVIILSYDKDGISYLEGNGNGNGLVRVSHRTWDEFNNILLYNRGYTISFIVTATDEFFSSVSENGSFWDVKNSEWFAPYVKTVYDYYLMRGKSAYYFGSKDTLTAAEAIVIAARINSAYSGIDESFTPRTGEKWYMPYVRYALNSGIIKKAYSSYGSAITRVEFCDILSRALPEDKYQAIKSYGGFYDVNSYDEYFSAVKKLYSAGIITGYGNYFCPDDTIIRCEAAAITARIAEPYMRIT